MARPAGKSTGATSAMGLARFLPLVLAELTEVAPSSMSVDPPAPATWIVELAGGGPEGAGGAVGGDGPSSIVAQGSWIGSAGAGAEGRWAADPCAAIAEATLPQASTGAPRTGRADGGRSGASGCGPTDAKSGAATASNGPT